MHLAASHGLNDVPVNDLSFLHFYGQARQTLPAGDRRSNRAFARRRIVVEHGIGKLRRYQAVTAVDRHHRRGAGARVRAIAGLVNLAIDLRRPA